MSGVGNLWHEGQHWRDTRRDNHWHDTIAKEVYEFTVFLNCFGSILKWDFFQIYELIISCSHHIWMYYWFKQITKVQRSKCNCLQFAQWLNHGLLIKTDDLILNGTVTLFTTSKYSFIVWAITAKWSLQLSKSVRHVIFHK